MPEIRRILIANRGEIAARIVRACFEEGAESVLAVSTADIDSLPARLADDIVVIGPASASESYLSVERIVQAALNTGCDAIHPGYGFLSERAELARACEAEGITFIGPPADVMLRAGDKLRARAIAAEVGIPTGQGSVALTTTEQALEAAEGLGSYPLLLKATAGGGGRGMHVVRTKDDIAVAFATASAEAERAFGDGTLYLEPYIERARHIEVQVLADRYGNVRHVGERDCSTQRRYQKIIEEAPAFGLPEALRDAVRESAVKLARSLNYVGAATCEFLVDVDRSTFVFLEVNARIQVEHPVSEMVSGIDLVREQIRIARGETISFEQEGLRITGHAIECRINAEDPFNEFLPTPGTITEWAILGGTGVRLDTFVERGTTITPHYDSMIGKLIVHAATRELAIERMAGILARAKVAGVSTTIPLLTAIMRDATFSTTPITTKWLEDSFLPAFRA